MYSRHYFTLSVSYIVDVERTCIINNDRASILLCATPYIVLFILDIFQEMHTKALINTPTKSKHGSYLLFWRPTNPCYCMKLCFSLFIAKDM